MAEPVSAAVLSAIAHPQRLALLVALERRPMTLPELAAAAKTTEALAEQAVSVLHDVGLVTTAAGRLRTTGRGWANVAGALIQLDRASRRRDQEPGGETA